jgi:hypothetical protein
MEIRKANNKTLESHAKSLPKDKKTSLELLLFESIMFIIGDEDEDQNFHELKYCFQYFKSIFLDLFDFKYMYMNCTIFGYLGEFCVVFFIILSKV